MKNKKIIAGFGIVAALAAGFFFTGCDDKSSASAPSVETASVHEITLDDDVRESGLRIARVLLGDNKNAATIYARFSAHFSAEVILKAFDRTGNEIGRSKRTLSGDLDDAAYFDFVYDQRVPMKTASYFVLSFSSRKDVGADDVAEPAPEVAPEQPVAPAEDGVETAVPEPVFEHEVEPPPAVGNAEEIPESGGAEALQE
ncbi:MAG: hypothetical protein LUD39_03230 [Opitutae bacterium]|nr:hypothetical protein [Opitutae bacterium]MCD8298753.1 hypothetical protein [Opitutae bacterium]